MNLLPVGPAYQWRTFSMIAADDPVTAFAIASNSPVGVAGLASGKVFSFGF
jgi:hypothetical protein